MKEYSRCDRCRTGGLIAMIASIVLGAICAAVFEGFALIFFGAIFVLGLIAFIVGTTVRRLPARSATSS
jgi:hypothetical protein